MTKRAFSRIRYFRSRGRRKISGDRIFYLQTCDERRFVIAAIYKEHLKCRLINGDTCPHRRIVSDAFAASKKFSPGVIHLRDLVYIYFYALSTVYR